MGNDGEDGQKSASARVVVGRIVGAHALRGEVRMKFFGDGLANLAHFSGVWLGEGREDPDARYFELLGAGSGRAGEVRLALGGIESREEAEALRGALVLAAVTELPGLENDEYYWHQLVGCTVQDQKGDLIGRVREIWATGAHDLLVVAGEDGRQVLLPTAREIMTGVDLEARRITIDVIPGLIEDETEPQS